MSTSIFNYRKLIVFNAPNDNNNLNWENCIFENLTHKYGEEFPEINIEQTEWNEAQMQPHYVKGFETRGFIFRSKKFYYMKG